MPHAVFFTFLTDDLAADLIAPGAADFTCDLHSHQLPAADKAAAVATADFMVLIPGRVEPEVIRAGRRLKLIQLVSAGFEGMDLDLCRRLEIPVANNGGTNAIDVAEHTLALILGMYRRLPAMDRACRQSRETPDGSATYTIHGKTVGMVGMGHIGQQVARLLKGFGARLLYTDVADAPAALATQLGLERVALDTLLQTADIVSLHVPLNEHTRGLIDGRALGLMKPTALLVNTCRGGVIHEPALVEALVAGRLMGAALDVVEEEPICAEHPFCRLENVLLTPHTAGTTRDTWARRGQFIFDNMRRVWAGQAPLARVEG